MKTVVVFTRPCEGNKPRLKRTLKSAGITVAIVAAALTLLPSGARADLIFSEDFNSYSGTGNGNQIDTVSLPVAFDGTVTGWTGTGGNAIHGVETSAGDWTVMVYEDNALTLHSGVSADDLGVNYALTFDYGTAAYQVEDQATTLDDGLVIDILRADNSVLAEQTFQPGAWGSGNYDLEAGLTGTVSYTGDGSGPVRIEISAVQNESTRFGGSIDNLSLDTVAPEPGGFVLAAAPALALFAWVRRRRPANQPAL